MNHKKCSNDIIKNTIKEFNKKELKLRNNKPVKDKKQAIAIALSTVNKECTYNKEELKELQLKVKNVFLENKELTLSNIIETKKIINMYIGKKKYKHAYEFYNLLIKRIIHQKLTPNIIKEISNIN